MKVLPVTDKTVPVDVIVTTGLKTPVLESPALP